MLSFRKKILFLDVILFLTFIALLFPFVERTVGDIMRKSLENRAQQLIDKLKDEPDLAGMLEVIQTEEEFTFQRVTLFDLNQHVLYDSDSRRKRDSSGVEQQEHSPEIEQAIQYGRGYSEYYSSAFDETFAFIALTFESHGVRYVLRTGFPFSEIQEMTVDFEFGFLALGSAVLLLYSLMTLLVIHRLTRPIQEIINAILPYQEGREEHLPKIVLQSAAQNDEFSKLGLTLNSLSDRIQNQIENLKQQRRETAVILESLGEGVIALDISGKVTFANKVSCGMLGVSHDLLIGQSLDRMKGGSEGLLKKCHELVLQALQTLEPIVQTWTVEEGTKIHLDLISSPLAQQSGALLVLQDKTSDYKVLEMGKDFVANASHELRTPITIIRGFAETLQDLPDLSQEMLAEITEKIVRTCGRLDKLVKSLLTLADIENFSEERFYTCDLVSIAENCKHLLLSAHPDVNVVLKAEIEKAPFRGDSELLDLAIMNLLENSVKYSVHPAEIVISIKKRENRIDLSVKDSGIGIPETDLPHIFGRFYTVDKARSRKSGGTGLGLSIVKTIIDKHRGNISVVSELGKGTTFTISLPLKSSIF